MTKYRVKGIPTLIILNPTGQLVTRDGRRFVSDGKDISDALKPVAVAADEAETETKKARKAARKKKKKKKKKKEAKAARKKKKKKKE